MLLDCGCYIRPVTLGWYRWLRMRDCRLPLYLTLSNIPKERRSHWLSMFGNGVPGNIIQPKTVKLTMHNEELYDLYASQYVPLWSVRLTICYFMICTLHRMLLYDIYASAYVTLWYARLTVCYFMIRTPHRMLFYDLYTLTYVTL
jgi:hypothetical protein